MLMGSFSFACMVALANTACQYFPWQLVAMTRSVVPFMLVMTWALSAGATLAVWRPGVLWMRSLSGSISLIGTFYAISKLPPSEAITITNTYPIWVALLSWPILGEVPALSTWLGVVCAVAGIFVIYPIDQAAQFGWPVLVAVLASLATAFAMLGLNQLKNVDTRAVVVHFSFTALVFATGAYFVFDRPTPRYDPTPWALACILGAGVTAMIGQLFLTKAFTAGQAAKVAVVNLTQIPMTLGLQLMFLEYPITLRKACGIALILGPTAWLMVQQQMRRAKLDRMGNPAEADPARSA
jgi:drug/metabolite transporter (DMT)-like permease